MIRRILPLIALLVLPGAVAAQDLAAEVVVGVRLGERDAPEAAEQLLERDTGLEPRKRRSRAEVHAVTEAQDGPFEVAPVCGAGRPEGRATVRPSPNTPRR